MIIGEFCDAYPPELDGVGTVVNAYCKELNILGNSCYYIAPNAPHYVPHNEYPVMNYVGVPIHNESYRLGLPALDFKFEYKMLTMDFDILHSHSPFTAGIEAVKTAFLKNKPLVGTFHSKYYDDFYSKTHSELLSKLGVKIILDFYNCCDEVWAVNQATASVLADYGYKKDIIVMPNGTDLWYPTAEDCKTAREKFNLTGKNILLFVGQHNFKKNTKSIIEAVKIYSENHTDFQMVFAGQGPDADAMKQLCADLGIADKTLFLGHIMDKHLLMGLYSVADLLVFPSIYDNAPMVVREAASTGTPSLLIKGSCSAEGVTDGVNGFLCENSPESIEKGIERALSADKSVGENARETIPLAWSAVVKTVNERYESLCRDYDTGVKRKRVDMEEFLNQFKH